MNKNEDSSINSGSKEEVTQIASHVASITASAVLANLDRYMAASGYDADHPWRAEIATATGSGHAATDAVDDIIMMNETVDSLLVLAIREIVKIDSAGHAKAAIYAARRYVADVDVGAKFLIGSAS
jgi:hypothetical protein